MLMRRPILADLLIIGAIALALHALSGCGGAGMRPVRSAIDVSSRAVAAADVGLAEAYRARASSALESSRSLEEYRARMAPLDVAEASLRATHGALLVAQAAADARDVDGARGAIACVREGLIGLVRALDAAGVSPPMDVRMAIGAILSVADLAGECQP